ncbi:MAG: hypothetical protein A2283_19745 [Lentisphaerae bacterium RIFOXYA12_FULL_48_11]|nr:MAG: hypothetical protein A2283_19745 [Lentisphaerae bacterium RIFOXYA12_FULL_48_11]
MRNILGNEMFDKSSIVPHIAMESKRQNCVSLPVFSLCYAGSMLKRSPKVFLEGVRRFIDSNHPKERISVLFLGEHFDAVRESALTLGLDGLVQIEKGVAYKDAMKRIEMCTVALLIEAQMQEGIFLPSKIIDYIQVGRPVLAISPLDGTISDLIRKYGGGVVADCFSPESVANAIGLLYSSWRKGTLDHEYGSWRLLSQFSSGHVIGLYNQLFHLVLQRKHV